MQKKKTKIKKILKDVVEILAGIVLAYLICAYIAQPVMVNGSSMYPNLQDGNIGITSRMFSQQDIERFDIVVINVDGKNIIKRVIGLPGENVQYIDNKLYIDDEYIEESFIDTITDNYYVHVPEGQYCCLGDNRQHSSDTRYYGTFKLEQIVAKDIFLLFPLKGLIN